MATFLTGQRRLSELRRGDVILLDKNRAHVKGVAHTDGLYWVNLRVRGSKRIIRNRFDAVVTTLQK